MYAENGKRRWRYKVDSKIFSTPAIADGMVIISAVNGEVFAIK